MADNYSEVPYHYVQALKTHTTVEALVYYLLRGYGSDTLRALAKGVAYEVEVRDHRRPDLTGFSLEVGDLFLTLEPIICRLWRDALEQEQNNDR